MDNLDFLVAAYTIIWIAISSYVLIIYRTQRQLRREIDSLKEKIMKKGAGGEK